jgi:hypothetical protein
VLKDPETAFSSVCSEVFRSGDIKGGKVYGIVENIALKD